VILITGCARSGTSLTTQMLEVCGAKLGPEKDVNALYENVVVRQSILKPMISEFGGDPLGQSHFPAPSRVKEVPGLQGRVLGALGGNIRGLAYKDAKLALVWQAWAKAFPMAKWVLVRRDRVEIIDSCIRTSFMAAHGNDRDAWGRWVDEQVKRFDAMKVAGLDIVEVWPRRVIRDAHEFAPVADHCGLRFDPRAVRRCVKPDLYR